MRATYYATGTLYSMIDALSYELLLVISYHRHAQEMIGASHPKDKQLSHEIVKTYTCVY